MELILLSFGITLLIGIGLAVSDKLRGKRKDEDEKESRVSSFILYRIISDPIGVFCIVIIIILTVREILT